MTARHLAPGLSDGWRPTLPPPVGARIGPHLNRFGAADRPCILVADDDREFRELLALVLRRHGYLVLQAASGEGLADRLASHILGGQVLGIDLLVTDERMPGWRGLDALQAIREARWDLPTIVVTALADATIRQRAEDLGAVALLEKPFDIQELLDRIQSAGFPGAAEADQGRGGNGG